MLKVLIDYDNPYLSRSYAWKRGWQLIKYAVASKLGLKTDYKTANETDDYLDTILALNKLCGVETIIGLRNTVEQEKPYLRESLSSQTDLRSHIHIGANSDSNRKRIWIPSLDQSKNTWHYDQDYVAGKAPKLQPEELPVWHADYPYLLPKYIEFLYRWKIQGESPYMEVLKH